MDRPGRSISTNTIHANGKTNFNKRDPTTVKNQPCSLNLLCLHPCFQSRLYRYTSTLLIFATVIVFLWFLFEFPKISQGHGTSDDTSISSDSSDQPISHLIGEIISLDPDRSGPALDIDALNELTPENDQGVSIELQDIGVKHVTVPVRMSDVDDSPAAQVNQAEGPLASLDAGGLYLMIITSHEGPEGFEPSNISIWPLDTDFSDSARVPLIPSLERSLAADSFTRAVAQAELEQRSHFLAVFVVILAVMLLEDTRGRFAQILGKAQTGTPSDSEDLLLDPNKLSEQESESEATGSIMMILQQFLCSLATLSALTITVALLLMIFCAPIRASSSDLLDANQLQQLVYYGSRSQAEAAVEKHMVVLGVVVWGMIAYGVVSCLGVGVNISVGCGVARGNPNSDQEGLGCSSNLKSYFNLDHDNSDLQFLNSVMILVFSLAALVSLILLVIFGIEISDVVQFRGIEAGQNMTYTKQRNVIVPAVTLLLSLIMVRFFQAEHGNHNIGSESEKPD